MSKANRKKHAVATQKPRSAEVFVEHTHATCLAAIKGYINATVERRLVTASMTRQTQTLPNTDGGLGSVMLQPASVSPTGILPEELLYPAKLPQVMQFCQALPVSGEEKLSLLMGYARAVGLKINASQRRAVLHSGTDYEGPIPLPSGFGDAT